MNVNTIKSFIKFIKQSRYNEFSMKDGEVNLKIKFRPYNEDGETIQGIDNTAAAAEKHNAETAREKKESEFYKIITAPIVGRFYSTMTSEKLEPIKKGDEVKKNQTICMIEAMNIEHEISSPYSGVMDEILADEGAAVMFGQPLFKIRINN